MNYISKLLLTASAIAGSTIYAAEPDLSKLPPASTQKGITYAKEIRPLFEKSCFRCHGPEKQKGELRLDSLEAVLKGSEDGKVVIPGSNKSPLLISVAQLNPKTAMPPKPREGRGPGGGGERRGGPPSGAPGQPGTNAPAGGLGQRQGRGPGGNFPPATPLTPEQVGLVRAWIEQGAK